MYMYALVMLVYLHSLGIEKLRFKPAYNPYTEPSMEVFSYHEGIYTHKLHHCGLFPPHVFCMYAGLGKWVEVGNSGMFRPEMLLPMGLPREVSVIAWGVSLERYIHTHVHVP